MYGPAVVHCDAWISAFRVSRQGLSEGVRKGFKPKGWRGGPKPINSGGPKRWGTKGRGLEGGGPKGGGPEGGPNVPLGFHTTARELQTCTGDGPGASNTTKISRENGHEPCLCEGVAAFGRRRQTRTTLIVAHVIFLDETVIG